MAVVGVAGIDLSCGGCRCQTVCATPVLVASRCGRCRRLSLPLSRLAALAHVAEKADVWSLGVVFWEMLTLEVPFADMPPAQLIGGAWLMWGPAEGGYTAAWAPSCCLPCSGQANPASSSLGLPPPAS